MNENVFSIDFAVAGSLRLDAFVLKSRRVSKNSIKIIAYGYF